MQEERNQNARPPWLLRGSRGVGTLVVAGVLAPVDFLVPVVHPAAAASDIGSRVEVEGRGLGLVYCAPRHESQREEKGGGYAGVVLDRSEVGARREVPALDPGVVFLGRCQIGAR
eukprot:995733-Rhodomonas_salina.1